MTESRAFIKSTVTVCACETCNCPPNKPWGQAYLSIPSEDEPAEQFLASFRRRMKTVKKWKEVKGTMGSDSLLQGKFFKEFEGELEDQS